MRRLLVLVGVLALAAAIVAFERRSSVSHPEPTGWTPFDHVADGDTIVLRGKITVRLVQIDTPEVYFHAECFGEQASAETKRLVSAGSLVRLVRDPATDDRDQYGRLLRYVILRDGTNLNVQLVAGGFAAPYFFGGVRGVYAKTLLDDAASAQVSGLGLWGACAGTRLAPDEGVSTGDA
jgi:micrococcal nuclease